jgi:VCBS repeat-containing protein
MNVWRSCACFVVATAALAAGAGAATLNEIRFDQIGTDNDEYVEVRGEPGESLDGVYLIVVGDNADNSSGVIEVAVSLSGYAIPDDGYFLVTETGFTLCLEQVDRSCQLNFENGDNVTVMLVSSLTGSVGQDLDTDDDGTLDVEPWDAVIDRVALTKEDNPPAETEYHYGPPAVGPDGWDVPYHVYKMDGEPAVWLIGPRDIEEGRDTPGTANRSPVSLAQIDLVTDEDAALALPLADFEGGFEDLDGRALTSVTITSLPVAGVLTLGGSPVEAGEQIDASVLDELAYEPAPEWSGDDSFDWTATNGIVWADAPATVMIHVAALNDLPVAFDDAYALSEDGVLTVDAAGGVLANDFDGDGDTVSAEVLSAPLRGTLVVDADGSLTYTPDADFWGADAFTYLASDAQGQSAPATVVLTVAGVNDVPVAVAETFAVDEDQVLAIDAGAGVLANDTDGDGDVLTIEIAEPTAHGMLESTPDGAFVYAPDADFYGEDSFSYKVSDGVVVSALAVATIVVASVNDVPVACEDFYETDAGQTIEVDAIAGLLANDSDADGDALVVAVVSGPSLGELTLNGDGSFTYAADTCAAGIDSFTYVASDSSSDSEEATVEISIAGDVSEPSSTGGGSGQGSGGCAPGASLAAAELSLIFIAAAFFGAAFRRSLLRG